MIKPIGTSTVELGDPVEIRDKLEKLQEELGDSLKEDQSLRPVKKVSFQTRAPEALSEFWQKQDMNTKKAFRSMFGRIDHLLTIQTPVTLRKAAMQYWDPTYRCFTFGSIDLSPLMEEYAELLGYTLHANKIYNPREKTFAEAVISKLLGLPVKKIKEMGSTKGARWTFPEEILMNFAKENFHKEEGRFAFAIVIYGTVIFPCAGGNIDRGVIKMVNHVKHQTTPVPAILCETFRSLNHCRVSTEGRFIGCAQLLGIWLISHLKYDKTVGAPFVQFQKDDCQLRDPISDFEKALGELQVRLQPCFSNK
ncbi:uncharacterized protein LOC120002600 [Tripterygium wilfordii]|uniref:uncharacterized protein LOC120002600 n=1 Tax=Tripterygium wilfordii TaxID=458696 RepID=UPI0018F84ED9|nr:uncharacterized protein LOC120002600 [Tripterygium wilfordii]